MQNGHGPVQECDSERAGGPGLLARCWRTASGEGVKTPSRWPFDCAVSPATDLPSVSASSRSNPRRSATTAAHHVKTGARLTVTVSIALRSPAARYVFSWLIPSSGRGVCLVEHLRQLLALLLGGSLTGDAMLVCPVIRICVPRREHLVVMAGDLGHRNRRCPAHAPATLADLIWSFHLTTQ